MSQFSNGQNNYLKCIARRTQSRMVIIKNLCQIIAELMVWQLFWARNNIVSAIDFMEGTCNGTCSAFAFACAGNYELGHVYW